MDDVKKAVLYGGFFANTIIVSLLNFSCKLLAAGNLWLLLGTGRKLCC